MRLPVRFFRNAFLQSISESLENLASQKNIRSLIPYRQIPETISKKRAVTQGISRKLFPDFFPDFAILGRDSGNFPETFSRYWKKFPKKPLSHDRFWEYFCMKLTWKWFLENPLSHAPKLQNLEKKSGKSFRDIPLVTARFFEIVSGICLYGLTS